MKTRLNLYTGEYVPKVTFISLNSVTFSICFLIFVFVLSSLLMAWHADSLNNQLRAKRKAVDALQRSVDLAQKQLTELKPDPKLIKAIEAEKLSLTQRKRLLEELSSREEVKNNRFSQVLSDLDTADTPSLWLTNIQVSNNIVALEGYGTEPDAMPLWLANLSATQSFSGVQFEHAQMEKQDDGLFFTLRTEETPRVEQAIGTSTKGAAK